VLEHTQSPFKSLQWCPRHQKLSVKHEWPLLPAKIGFLKWDCHTTIYHTRGRFVSHLWCWWKISNRTKIEQDSNIFAPLLPNWTIGLSCTHTSMQKNCTCPKEAFRVAQISLHTSNISKHLFSPHRITFLTPLLIIPPIPLLPPASTCSRLSEVV